MSSASSPTGGSAAASPASPPGGADIRGSGGRHVPPPSVVDAWRTALRKDHPGVPAALLEMLLEAYANRPHLFSALEAEEQHLKTE